MHASYNRNIFVPSSVMKRRILDRPKPSYDENGNLEDIEDVTEETLGRGEEDSIKLRSYQVHKLVKRHCMQARSMTFSRSSCLRRPKGRILLFTSGLGAGRPSSL